MASIGDEESLLIELLQGPVKAYFDVENFDKNSLESQIEEDLATMRQAYKQTNKFLVSAF